MGFLCECHNQESLVWVPPANSSTIKPITKLAANMMEVQQYVLTEITCCRLQEKLEADVCQLIEHRNSALCICQEHAAKLQAGMDQLQDMLQHTLQQQQHIQQTYATCMDELKQRFATSLASRQKLLEQSVKQQLQQFSVTKAS